MAVRNRSRTRLTEREYHERHLVEMVKTATMVLNHRERLGNQVIRVGSLEEMMVGGEKVLLRCRRPHHALDHPNDFTIRTALPDPTEFDVLLHGDQRWYFYAYGRRDDEAPQLTRWHMLNLGVWREGVVMRQARGLEVGQYAGFPAGRVFRFSDYPGILHMTWTTSDGALF